MTDESIHLDVELTRRENDLVLLMVGYGAGMLQNEGIATIEEICALTNKLFAASPNFTPYVVNYGRIVRAKTQ